MSQKIVALGGGHGLAASLSAAKLMTDNITAIVTVADDGGSSGRLREEFGVLPPGDIRMALAALCDNSDWGTTWRNVLQHRFSSEGELDRHSLGNLMIVALWQLDQEPVAGLKLIGKLLNASGAVLPMALEPIVIEADVTTAGVTERITGQANVAAATGRIENLELMPAQPKACPEAITAVTEADWIILGPGSWFTSVLPHLMVPELRDAIVNSKARKCLTLNLSVTEGEVAGHSTAQLLGTVSQLAPALKFDAIIADPSSIEYSEELEDAANLLAAKLIFRQVRKTDGSAQHDPLRLAAAFRDIFDHQYGDLTPNK